MGLPKYDHVVETLPPDCAETGHRWLRLRAKLYFPRAAHVGSCKAARERAARLELGLRLAAAAGR